MPVTEIPRAFQQGMGDTLGFIAMVIGLGTVIGKLHSHFRRTESTRPVAPSVNVTDETMLESPSGPLMAHRVISLRCGIWSLPGHSGHRASPHQSGSIYEPAL